MGERKVLNKYYPPDFDPDKLRDNKRLIRKQRSKYSEIRMMMPWTAVCLTCGEFVPRGKKVNSRMERFKSDHFGIYAFRFFVRCLSCRDHFTFVTDPKNSDYVPEKNCKRTFDLWIEERDRAARQGLLEPVLEGEDEEEEEDADQMAALEARARESKREIDEMDALDELRSINARNQAVDLEALLRGVVRPADESKVEEQKISEEEEREIRRLFEQKRREQGVDEGRVRRIRRDAAGGGDVAAAGGKRPRPAGVPGASATAGPHADPAPAPAKRRPAHTAAVVRARPRPKVSARPKAARAPTKSENGPPSQSAPAPASSALGSLVAAYDDDDDDDDDDDEGGGGGGGGGDGGGGAQSS